MGLIVRNINFTGNFRGVFPQVPPPPPAPSDQYAQYTVLDLPGTGTNNTNNNVFLDSSSNNFSITRFGNTTQGSFSPFSTAPGYWSNYFDGSGDYLTATDPNAFALSGVDFTLESWVYLTAYPSSSSGIFWANICNGLSAVSNGFGFSVYGTSSSYGGLTFEAKTSTVHRVDIAASFNFSLNTWYHIALVKNGSTFTFFVNGTNIGSSNNSNSWSNQSFLRIGSYATANFEMNFPGYISNLRVVKGTALYTTNFTPSTTPLTAVSGTSLLTCQSNRFIDNSANNFAITSSGNTSVSAFGPYAPASSYNTATMGGSMYFDGNGDYLSTARILDNSNDITIEAWIYLTANAPVNGAYVLAQYVSGGANRTIFVIQPNSLQVAMAFGDTYVISTSGISLNTWTHLAWVRSGSGTNNFKQYINGILDGQLTYTGSFENTSSTIGGSNNLSNTFLGGYISNLRIVKGTALYTSNFTPPTAPVSAISGTSLLLNGTNAAIYDASTKNVLETVGNAVVSTTVSANGSMYFDGSGDYLNLILSNVTPTTFTVECWIYLTSYPSETAGIVSTTAESNSIQAWYLRIGSISSNKVVEFAETWGANQTTSPVNITLNTWTHIAAVRNGDGSNNAKLYVNGVNIATGTFNRTYQSTTMVIGRNYITSNNWYFPGYINNLRITNGIARYTANFTPPTRS